LQYFGGRSLRRRPALASRHYSFRLVPVVCTDAREVPDPDDPRA
jgi:hypothetical protein